MKTQLCFQIFLLPFYLILFGVDTIFVYRQCQINHQTILIQLKNELQFSSSLSTKLVSWKPNATDCCSWGGVTCSIKGQVIGLDLSNETIFGGMNDHSVLFGLKNLESLNFADNNFSFTKIPKRFGSLASLMYLNLSNSMFSGQIPEELSQLTRLKVLDLSSHFSFGIHSLKLENPNLTMLVRNLTRLRGLYMDNVNISSQKFDWCQGLSSSLPNLEVLSLSNCQLLGPLDESLEKLQSLSVISLALNMLSSPVPSFFANFKNLTVMNLAACNLTGTFPKEVLQLESLQILDLSVNTNLDGSLPDFPKNGSLRSLVLSNTNFSGEIPESIGNLKNLSWIELHTSNFSGRILNSMEYLTQLSYLDLSSNNFIGKILSFKLCKNLSYIDLSRNGLSGMIPFDHFQDLNNLVSVNLGFNSFNGSIPSSLFSLPNVQQIHLSNNNFNGLLPNFSNSSIPLLKSLDLSSNKLEGEIPGSYFKLGQISRLLLSSNNLSGVIEAKDLHGLSNLTTLDLSFNKFSILTSTNVSLMSYLPKFFSLKLASCNLRKFPNLRNQSRLISLDLSANKIQGSIPSYIWRVGNGSLSYMNLSHNQLTSLEEPYTLPVNLTFLDLHSNHLRGVIHVPPITAIYIDYSNNLLNSSLSEISWKDLYDLFFFSASDNLLTGTIPKTICKATNLKVVDLSNNRLTGRIPQCLIEFDNDLGVLNLANNGLTGQIEGTFPTTCSLNTLDLHGNYLEGKIPQSLVNCRMLHVLNLGNNSINDTYPCSLGTITNLHVLVLRSNRLHGSVHCGRRQYNWSNLQILDIAHNDFNDVLPPEFFSQWGAMMTVENRTSTKQLSFMVLQLSDLYFQDTVTVTVKGFELELVKILTLFTTIDISSNRFSGVIPETIGRLKALYLFNISHNEFTGSIPPSIGHLRQLESLDMSSNKITGEIPSLLATLPFLSVVNLSHNQLEGKIPTGSQFQTFSETSYLGNKRLCGFPLNRSCGSSAVPVPPSSPSSDTSSDGDDWQDIFYGMAAGAGSLTVAAVLYTLYKANTSSTTRQTRSV
ncbi:receptor-like protein 12 [Tanacetum coccineum]